MATITAAGNLFNTTSGTHTVTATPAANDLIVIIRANTGNTASVSPTDNNTDGKGTYTKVANSTKATSADTMEVYVRNALVANSVSTVFTDAAGTTTGGGLIVYRVSGMTAIGAAAIRQFATQSNQASGGTPTPVFKTNALTGNPIIGAVFNATSPATMTPRSSPAYTEDADVGYSIPTTGFEAMHVNSGETATSIAWGGTSASAFCSVAIELDTWGFSVLFQENFDGSALNLTSKTPTQGNSWSAVWTDTGSDTFSTDGAGLGVPAGLAGGGFIYTSNINVGGTANSSPDGYSEARITVNPDSTHPLYLVSRYVDTSNFYLIGFFGTFIRFYKCVAGTMSNPYSDVTLTTNVGDLVGVATFSTRLNVYVNKVMQMTITDSGVSSSGRNGIAAGDVTNRVDNSFSAGTFKVDNFWVSYNIPQVSPNAPILVSPADTATVASVTPALDFQGSDSNGDTLEYDIQIDTVNTFNSTGGLPLIDKLSSADPGFIDISNGAHTHPFVQSEQIEYTVQTSLTNATTYYWRVRAIDPTGSNTYGAQATTQSFTIHISTLINSSAKANIVAKTPQNTSAKANIKVTATQDTSVKANIKATTTQANSTIANVLVVNNTQATSVKANILATGNTQNNSTKADIKVTNTQATYALANILASVTQATFAKANILVVNNAKNESAKADIIVTNTFDTSAKANLVATTTKNTSVKADILSLGQQPTYTKANILQVNNLQANSSKANILVINQQANSVIANIEGVKSQSVKANILVTTAQNQSSKADILVTQTQATSAKANILTTGNLKANSAKADIFTTALQNNFVKANLLITLAQNSSVKADVLVSGTLQGESAKANLLSTNSTQATSAKANTLLTTSQGTSSKANVLASFTQQNSVKANVLATLPQANSVLAMIISTNTLQNNSAKANILTTYYTGYSYSWLLPDDPNEQNRGFNS